MTTKTVEKWTGDELALVLINHGAFYKSTEFFRQSLARKLEAGRYDKMLAIKGLSSLIAISLRSDRLCSYLGPINAATREYCANIILEHWDDELCEIASALHESRRKFLTCY